MRLRARGRAFAQDIFREKYLIIAPKKHSAVIIYLRNLCRAAHTLMHTCASRAPVRVCRHTLACMGCSRTRTRL
eukprot:6205480-Pleurochrysis_carterae.AAC.3